MRDRANICPCEHHPLEIRRDGHCKCVLFVGDNYDVERAYQPRVETEDIAETRSIRERCVTVYATRWCVMSRRPKALLRRRGVLFEDVDIEADPAAARRVEVWNNGYRSVPPIVIRQIMADPTMAELEGVLLERQATVMDCTVHVTSWCFHSRRTLRWLEDHAIEAKAVDVEEDREAAQRVQEWNQGDLSVPTLDVTVRLTEPSGHALEAVLGLGTR